ncbi:NADH dehydrogenase [ubiquinone] iron-sulfur protein 6, mitochondrial [Neodiprion pinetum]|uniref:NADH dehydrogenase [ubiquinone] iron-sulfur protein 6, mitochondrial n=1 Tax=Neodiprion lecontei TaxID=441921 RepID=A0A6J0BK44_NEOLC|nr:NADH dehydrogenase [ubiquinone] iron-sulfur protein 6, mitochondrial [Neodiprion lecontei]XP_046411247.1 NADH dehydrogenase [ubiquinone] iron-sulfur protein 6, mitochondrial [Neodiprion fabricii]XP_046466131.1 NADH dehydrogenase [ubiquinone] iron-sulfur protein 6, mitochondrial [Neodiprion pinetum]XP_046604163.1 NADH dehydrogenase [ubiquinone] iron-sulfur protein 6, mitochondrial [Neodiprion virginianus]
MACKKVVCLLGNQTKVCKINVPAFTTGIRNKASWEPVEKETHTGQKWDAKDYRLVRFVDKPKQVNPNWAINLIDDVPPTPTTKRVVACDGGGGPTGHPKVYINLDKPGNHSCGYCGLRFYKEDAH